MPLLPKKFPAPVAKPMMPFIAAALVVAYGVNAMQNAMVNTDEFRNDPRNPYRKAAKPEEKH